MDNGMDYGIKFAVALCTGAFVEDALSPNNRLSMTGTQCGRGADHRILFTVTRESCCWHGGFSLDYSRIYVLTDLSALRLDG